MSLFFPWSESYLYSWINTPKLDHRTLVTLLSTTVVWAPKQSKNITKLTVLCDFYKSIYVYCPYSSISFPSLSATSLLPWFKILAENITLKLSLFLSLFRSFLLGCLKLHILTPLGWFSGVLILCGFTFPSLIHSRLRMRFPLSLFISWHCYFFIS